MDLRLFYALILTLMPVTELRVGLPVAIFYALDNNIPIALIFALIVLINILLIFLIFYFLDNLHYVLMDLKFYKKFFELHLRKFQKKVDKFERRYEAFGFLALVLFVAIPLPGTGAWTGCLAAWLLGLERKKSILSISLGILIAGLLVLLVTLGFMEFLL